MRKQGTMLLPNPEGHYHFLQGIDPYSGGVIADPGYEIVHLTLAHPLPWREGFARIEDHLRAAGHQRQALCGVELRSPAPFTMPGFIEFNQTYCQVLKEWGLYIGDLNPVARTNVAPQHHPPETPALHGFSHTAPVDPSGRPTLVIAGAGELLEGLLKEEGIIRAGDTSGAAMREKAAYVMEIMAERLQGLGGTWEWINAVDVYTIHPLDQLIEDIVLSRLGPAGRHGIRWHHARPPIVDIEFEMDMRGVRQEVFI